MILGFFILTVADWLTLIDKSGRERKQLILMINKHFRFWRKFIAMYYKKDMEEVGSNPRLLVSKIPTYTKFVSKNPRVQIHTALDI